MTANLHRSPHDAPVSGPWSSSIEDRVTGDIERLRATFRSGRTRDINWRITQLKAIEQLLAENEADIATALAADLGRSNAEAWLGDVAAPKVEARYARKRVRRWTRRRHVALPLSAAPGRGWIEFEPLGLVLVIGPWNYPFYLTLGPLIGAIAAGNCVVIKPSEHAPASSALLAELIPRYLDNDAVQVIEGEAHVTQHLLAQGFDHAFFTGGPEIGKRIMEGAARHLTPVTLELGGKSPAIVTSHADLEVAAHRIAWSKFLNSGQTCIATDYVLVEHSVQEAFVQHLLRTMTEFRSGSPGTGVRIINRRQFERLAGLMADHQGQIVLGGGMDDQSLSFEPTVIVEPSQGSRVMTEEIFGPILPIVGVANLDEAIERINAGPKPLAAYLFSGSAAERKRMLAQVSCGSAVINHAAVHALVPQLPFGGVGNSGMGVYHGKYGFETLSNRKAVLSKPARPDLSVIYPPYTISKMRLMRRLF